MRAAPATIGGMPRSSKRASERQSATSSRSPCTTWIAIAVWPSLKVVKSCARAVGIVAVARDDALDQAAHGLDARATAESRRAAAARRRAALPASSFGLDRGAERHHLVRDRGWSAASRPKNSPTAARTSGMRVEPPTSTTPSTSSSPDLGVAQHLAHRGHRALDQRPGDRLELGARRPPARRARRRARQASVDLRRASDSASLAARAATSTARLSRRRLGGRRRPAASAQSASAASKSSPPSAESPPVATTSNTPLVRRSSEMSKVPPPRS